MKKYLPIPLTLVVAATIASFVGFDANSDLKINELFTRVGVADVEVQQAEQAADGLRYWAYDAIFSLSLGTLEAGKEGNGITLNEEGDAKIYTFDNAGYIQGYPDATVSGHMKAMNGETTDKSEVSLTFTNDPQGLKTITIQSSGPHGQAHSEGVLMVNGEESSFLEFVAYFGRRLSQ